jgi:hypothetical protein
MRKRHTMADIKAEGWNAFFYGKSENTPYPLGSQEESVWLEGYVDAYFHERDYYECLTLRVNQ